MTESTQTPTQPATQPASDAFVPVTFDVAVSDAIKSDASTFCTLSSSEGVLLEVLRPAMATKETAGDFRLYESVRLAWCDAAWRATTRPAADKALPSPVPPVVTEAWRRRMLGLIAAGLEGAIPRSAAPGAQRQAKSRETRKAAADAIVAAATKGAKTDKARTDALAKAADAALKAGDASKASALVAALDKIQSAAKHDAEKQGKDALSKKKSEVALALAGLTIEQLDLVRGAIECIRHGGRVTLHEPKGKAADKAADKAPAKGEAKAA